MGASNAIKALTLSERLQRQLTITDTGCHEWRGTLDGDGYGHLKVGGKTVKAHRLAWTLANGPIPDGLNVLHHCDNPPCCLVAHLFLGTHADNSKDKMAKGRHGHSHNELKTHCLKGHPYDEANTYVTRGRRQCRACNRAAVARYTASKRLSEAS